jgi:SAM-dependent methyltransferase
MTGRTPWRPKDPLLGVRSPVGERGIPQFLSQVCDEELIEYGDTARGAGYTRGEEVANVVYQVMLDVVRPSPGHVSILDLGCGTGRLVDYAQRTGIAARMDYRGLDLSELAIDTARRKFPHLSFGRADVLEDEAALGDPDYIIMNGLFQWRGPLSRETMRRYWQSLLAVAFRHARLGIAFNAMTSLVEWEREDLFHLPLEEMVAFVSVELSRHFVVRHDYGVYEYTTYVYRDRSTAAVST